MNKLIKLKNNIRIKFKIYQLNKIIKIKKTNRKKNNNNNKIKIMFKNNRLIMILNIFSKVNNSKIIYKLL